MNITFTEAAQKYLANLLEKQGVEGIGVRLFVSNPGTPHAETCLAYCKPGEEKEGDLKMDLEYFPCHVEGVSEPFLDDAMVDFAEDKLGGQLTIKAPNAKLPKVNDDSPLDMKINYFLQMEVNPGLASHGGMVSLVELEDDVAILQFGGGCQGCAAVDLTLKDGVEKTLMERIPELKGVRDVTDHTNTDNAFYK
ncbi:Fe-S biogenesis protein NfuA [uncultured Endozoicomonas sp.]|uniref:Fe-S biogenesis protein NfuA n=1 Tax=uncultured Endozoicomonas sp. TaxID=432652 RepID=UPI0026251CB8|nr:Fe-S biogenesis protein NfuA [uncultured Endozoicomonas sp.]